jgi:hypothetical protein
MLRLRPVQDGNDYWRKMPRTPSHSIKRVKNRRLGQERQNDLRWPLNWCLEQSGHWEGICRMQRYVGVPERSVSPMKKRHQLRNNR